MLTQQQERHRDLQHGDGRRADEGQHQRRRGEENGGADLQLLRRLCHADARKEQTVAVAVLHGVADLVGGDRHGRHGAAVMDVG